MFTAAAFSLVVLADETPKGPEFGKAAPTGLFVILALLVVTFLLVRSMNKHIKQLPESFDTDNPGPDQAVDSATDDPEPHHDGVVPNEQRPLDDSGGGRVSG